MLLVWNGPVIHNKFCLAKCLLTELKLAFKDQGMTSVCEQTPPDRWKTLILHLFKTLSRLGGSARVDFELL